MSTNEYFDNADLDSFPRGSTARAEAVDAKFDAITVGLDKLPTEANLKGGKINFAVSTGSGGDYIVFLPSGPSAYVDGQELVFRANHATPGGSTVNVNGLGVKSLRRRAGGVTVAGDILEGGIVTFRYSSSTGYFEMQQLASGDMAAIDNCSENIDAIIQGVSSLGLAGIASDVVALAAVADDIGAIGPIAADVTTAAGISADVSAVAAVASEVNLCGDNIGAITTLAESIDDGILVGVATTTGIQTLTNKTINLTSNTMVATSAQLATAITDETGTGSLVFATSPTFSGTPLAPTPSIGTNTTQIATTAFVNSAQSAGRATLTAAEEISSGAVVVLNSDGTISEVGSSVSSGSAGTEQTHISTAGVTYTDSVSIPGTDMVVSLYVNSTHFAAVGTINDADNSIVFEAPVAIPSPMTRFTSITWDDVNSKVIIGGTNATTTGYVVIGSLSGATLTFGTPLSIGSVISASNVIVNANTHQSRVMVLIKSVSYLLRGASYNAASNTIGSFVDVTFNDGSDVTLIGSCEVNGTPYTAVLYHITSGGQTSQYFRVRFAEINATVVTARTEASTGLYGNTTGFCAWDSVHSRLVFVYNQTSVPSSRKYCVCSVSGYTITTGTLRVFDNSTYDITKCSFDTTKGMFVFSGIEDSTGYLVSALFSISGDTIVESNKTYINSSTSSSHVSAYNYSTDRVLFLYKDAGNSNYGSARIWDSGTLATDANDWIGISDTAISSGVAGTVTIKGGVCQSLSGLTTGYTYYIDDFGALQQSGSRRAGVALSATKLFLMGNA